MDTAADEVDSRMADGMGDGMKKKGAVVKILEYHDEPLDFTHPIMEYIKSDEVADNLRQVRGVAEVNGEKKIFTMKYNGAKVSKREARKHVFEQLKAFGGVTA